MPAPTQPTVTEVASLLRARTVDKYGVEKGTFDTETTPTAAEVTNLIGIATTIVKSRVGRTLTQELADEAKPAIMLLTAQLVETTYFPEEANQQQSAAQLYGSMYEDAVRGLSAAIEDDQPGTVRGFMTSMPVYGIEGGPTLDLPINWEQLDLDEKWALEGLGVIPPRASEGYLDEKWVSGQPDYDGEDF